LGKVEVKMSFKSDMIVMTKNNESTFFSFAYIVESYDVWNIILWLINMHAKQSRKCDICVKSNKITKKTYHSKFNSYWYYWFKTNLI